MKISDFINNANVTINISAADLKEFVFNILDEYKASEQSVTDKRLTIKEAADYLSKSVPTLWRWKAQGYLMPDGQIGKNPYYLLSTLNQFGKEAHNG